MREDHLCLYCMDDLPLTRFWTLNHNPMSDKFNALLQEWPGSAGEKYAHAMALFFYNSEAGYTNIPQRLKYDGDLALGRYFGSMLGQRLLQTAWASDIDLVVPVPLHWKRLLSRGYNQAEIIASAVASQMNVPLAGNGLKRVKSTKTQTRLDVDQKSRNVSGAFVPGDLPADVKHILLVDDIFTTGSTLLACFTALREVFPAGTVRISVATLGVVGRA